MSLIWGLSLLVLANGAPVIARRLLGERWAMPVDAGLHLAGGQPLFGSAKTWRGLIAAMLVCAPIGALQGMGVFNGALFGVLSMLGDLLASFIKRRLGIPASGRAWFLDQIPEGLLPLAVLREPLGLDWLDVLLVATSFTLFEWLVSPWLYRLRIRRKPY